MTRQILLADDDADDRYLFEQVFRELGDRYRLVTFENGSEVIDFLSLGLDKGMVPADLVILDQNMPVRNGSETLRFIRTDARLSDIPVIIFSTCYDPTFATECEMLGAQAVLAKPDSYDEYLEMIRGFVRQVSL